MDTVEKEQERSFLMHEFVEVGSSLRWWVTPWVQVDDPLKGYMFVCKVKERKKLADLS